MRFSAFFISRIARLFKLVSYEAKKFSNASNCQRQYELSEKSGKYTCRALSQKGTKFRREARLAPAARALDGGEAFFGGSDAVGLFDGHDEDFAVADFACVG